MTTGVTPEGSGTVTGAGSYNSGDLAWVTATPNTGYVFIGWMETGDTVNKLPVWMYDNEVRTAFFMKEEDAIFVTIKSEPENEPALEGKFPPKFLFTGPNPMYIVPMEDPTPKGFIRWDVVVESTGVRTVHDTEWETAVQPTENIEMIAVFDYSTVKSVERKTNQPDAIVVTDWMGKFYPDEGYPTYWIDKPMIMDEITGETRYKFLRWEEKNLSTGEINLLNTEDTDFEYTIPAYSSEVWYILEDLNPPPVVIPEPDPEIPPTVPIPPENDMTDNNTLITIDLPIEGTHYQVSNDGITWSEWYIKPANTNKVQVETQTGEGLKRVYYRTADLEWKKAPMFDGTDIKYFSIAERVVNTLYNTEQVSKIIDYTSPKIKINSEDTTFITNTGEKDISIDITDNLDKSPQVNIEVYKSDNKGRKQTQPINTVGGTMPEGKTRISINIPNLTAQKYNGKLLPYFLRIEVIDHKGNSAVETVLIYSKD